MSEFTMTWQQFLKDAEDFLKLAERLKDNWSWHQKDAGDGNGYLVYKHKIHFPSEERIEIQRDSSEISDIAISNEHLEACPGNDLLQIEYHVVYSISYQVPVLYFLAHKSDGSLLQLEDAWRLFRTFGNDTQPKSRAEMLSILTQMEHPVLFRPFLGLHPCRSAELLSQSSASRNHVLTFLSLMGPYVHLKLANEYGLEITK